VVTATVQLRHITAFPQQAQAEANRQSRAKPVKSVVRHFSVMTNALAPAMDGMEAAAVLQLRVVLARARVHDTSVETDADPSALANAIARALQAVGVNVQAASPEAEWQIACSPEVYEDRAVIESLLLIGHACARRGRPNAARGVMAWLRRSVEDARIVDLLWRLMQVEAGVLNPADYQSEDERDGFGALLAAMAQYPTDPQGAIAALQSLRWSSPDPELRDLALFLATTLGPNRRSTAVGA
jgi:hypothetical protein